MYTANEKITNNIEKLPENIKEAIDIAKNSEFIKNTIGEEVLSKYICLKEEEYNQYISSENKEEIKKMYFECI